MTNQIRKAETKEVAQVEVKKAEIFTPDMLVDKEVALQMAKKIKGMQYMAQGIKEALVSGTDYDKIQGCGDKPTLLKSGASKICLLFGLIQQYAIVKAESDYNKSFTIQTKYGAKTVQGLFNYVIEVKLINNDGTCYASGIGQCTNKEKGKQEMNENSIVKMAKKRALVDAVLSIADMSAVFAQDLEDYGTKVQFQNKVKAAPQINKVSTTPDITTMTDDEVEALLNDI